MKTDLSRYIRFYQSISLDEDDAETKERVIQSACDGLCLMQRIQDSCDGFRRDIQAMIDSDAVENVVERNLQELFPQLVSAITDEIFGDIIPRSFHAWKRGDIPTVKEMEETLGNECKLIIQQPKMQEKLHPIIARWLQTLRPEIEEITTPICIKNGIEPTRLLLPNFVDIGTGLPFKPGMSCTSRVFHWNGGWSCLRVKSSNWASPCRTMDSREWQM